MKNLITLLFITIVLVSNAQTWNESGNTITTSSPYIGTNGSSSEPLRIRTSSYTGNNMLFQTNGANTRMTILGTNGNVGIGTITPAFLLQITGGDMDLATSSKGYKLKGKTMVFNNGTDNNIFLGYNSGISTLGEENVFAGFSSGLSNVWGAGNVFVGSSAGAANNDGNYNTAVGKNAANANVSGSKIAAFGYNAGNSNTSSSGVFVGYQAGFSNTTGLENVHVGHEAAYYNATGSYNTTLGFEAGDGVASNNYSYNTFLGNHSGRVNTNGEKNVFVGMNSGYNNSSADYNSFVGYNAGVSNTTGSLNSLLGYQAGYTSSTASNQTFVGGFAGFATTGANNTALGYQAGYANTTGTNNTFVGYGADATAGTYTNAMAIGNGASVNGSNKIAVGNTTITHIQGQVNFTTFSDGRFKFNVNEDVKGLDFIKRLRPVTYQLNTQQIDEFLHPNGFAISTTDSSTASTTDYVPSTNIIRTGFIAQEVEQAALASNFVTDIVSHPADDQDNYALAYGGFVVPLVKAVQEQQDSIADLKAALAALNGNLDEFKHAERSNSQNQNDSIAKLLKRLTNLEEAVKLCCAAPTQNRLEGGDSENGGVSYTSNATEQPNLLQNSPNPFSTNTNITYYLPQGVQNAQLKIYNTLGAEMRVFQLNGVGYGQVNIQGGSLAAGNYNYSLSIDGQNYQTKTMVLTK